MSDKDFKVKNKLVVNGLTGGAGPLIANSNKEIDSAAFLTTLQGGTGTTTSPAAGQVLYSAGGTSYNPTALNTLDVKGATYSADAPSSPVVGQIWVESDTSSDSFDPNIIRRKSFTATAAQTTFTTDVPFIQGYEQVFFNGMLLVRNNDYTTTNDTTVVLTTGAAVNDVVEVVTITNLNSINTVATTGANTITSTTASTTPLAIEGAVSQSASLFNIKNSVGEIRHEFLPNGSFTSRGTSADGSAIIVERYGPTDPVAVLALRGYGGTVSSSNSVSQDNRLGLISAEGWDGTAIRASSRITFSIDGPVIPGNLPGKITFNTVPVGGGAGHIERMRIDSAGNIGINNTSPVQFNSSGKVLNITGTASNSGPSTIMQIGSTGTSGAGYSATEVFAISGITSATEITRVTGTGANGFRAYFKVIVTGHVGSVGNGINIKEFYWDGSTNSPVQISTYTANSFPVISFDTTVSHRLVVLLASSNGTSTFNGVMKVEWMLPIDFASSTYTIS